MTRRVYLNMANVSVQHILVFATLMRNLQSDDRPNLQDLLLHVVKLHTGQLTIDYEIITRAIIICMFHIV